MRVPKLVALAVIAFFLGSVGYAVAAPYYVYEPTLLPQSNNAFDLGTSTQVWRNAYITQLCLSADCRTVWPSGGSGGGTWAFTPTTNYGINVQATTTPLWFQNGLMASTTSYFVNASSSALTVNRYANIGTCSNPAGNLLANNFYLDICGSDNSLAGINGGVININPGNDAYATLYLGNNRFDSTLTHLGYISYTGSNYNETAFGTGMNVANQLQIGNFDGPITLAPSTTTSAAYINALVGGTATNNEIWRTTTLGLGIGTTSPDRTLSVGGNVIIGASTAGGTNGNLTIYNVTTTGVIGTGNLVLSISPTLSGTVSIPNIRSSTAVTSSLLLEGTSSAVPTTAKITLQAGTALSTVMTGLKNGWGIGTIAPNWELQLATSSANLATGGSFGQLALTDTNAGSNLKHWLVSSWNGNLFFSTTTDAFATSSATALTIDTNGNVIANCFKNPGGACITGGGGGSGTVTNVATDATLTGGPITTTGTLGINLTNPNSWTGLQTFSNATTTLLSASYASSTNAFFGNLSVGALSGFLKATAGAVATALINLTSDVTGTLPAGNGGTGATSLSPFFSVVSNVFTSNEHHSFTYATSTWVGTTTVPLEVGYGEVWQSIKCFTDVGTVNTQVGYGSASTTMFNASTTIGTITYSSNNTMTAGNKVKVDLGTPASSPTKITCTEADQY